MEAIRTASGSAISSRQRVRQRHLSNDWSARDAGCTNASVTGRHLLLLATGALLNACQATHDAAPSQSLPDPSAIHCEDDGYDYSVNDRGIGICTNPVTGTQCAAW